VTELPLRWQPPPVRHTTRKAEPCNRVEMTGFAANVGRVLSPVRSAEDYGKGGSPWFLAQANRPTGAARNSGPPYLSR
jgi:hypothetical protein